MASQKSVIIDNAQQFAAKGRIDKAIAEWKKLLAETPQDGNIYNNISDLYLRINDKASAIDACLKAASVYREAGFELKGVAVLKKVLKLDPNRIGVYEMLADINADRGLVGNAVEGYQQTAKLYMKNGNFRGAIAVYQKLGKFTPEDPEIPLAVARLYQKQEKFREAVFSYEQAEAIYEGKNMVSEARQIIEEIIKIDPGYLKHLVAKEAALSSIGELGIERDITLPPPKRGTTPANSVEPPQFSIEDTKGDPLFMDEMDIFRDIIPEDTPPPIIWPPNKPTLEDVLAVPVPARSQTVIEDADILIQPYPNQDKVEGLHKVSDVVLDAHLSEADAYIKYELNQNAIEKLVLVTALAPMREEPYIKLKDLYLKEGQKDKAVAACLSLADIYEKKGDFDQREVLSKEIRGIDPSASLPESEMRGTLSKPLEVPDVFADFPPLPDDLGNNKALQAKRETDLASFDLSQSGFLSEATPASVTEESFDLSAITQDFRDMPVDSLPIVQGEKKPIRSDIGVVQNDQGIIQNDKKQQYLETCYHLGIAQKEMGNFSKAIREFEQALDGAGRFQEVLSLLASCYAEQGDLAHAATVLQKGVDDPRCNEGVRFAILYDLASIYGQIGDKEKAFSIYKDIYRVNPNFRDVSGKVKEIPYLKLVPETIRVKEPVLFISETSGIPEKAAPVLKEKRRISYV